jgi:hypothetical protein
MKQFLLYLFIFFYSVANSQSVVKGVVTDAKTNQPVSFVTVSFNNSTISTSTDDAGRFTLNSGQLYTQIKLSMVGYKTIIKDIKPGGPQFVSIKLEEEAKTLNEVTISSKKREKYHNRDNPAVELIRKVILNKSQNRVESYDYAEFEQYEKLQFSISNLSPKISENRFFRKYKFLLDNRDSTTVPGKSLLPVYMDERISSTYLRKAPEAKKTIVKAEKKVNFGESVDNEGINAYLNRMYADVDIYANNIFLMTNQFLSPIADGAPAFYKFFITDTLIEGNSKLIELSFTPRNTTDMLFEGQLYVTMDGNYAVQRAKLSINKNINLNWVRDMFINQDFDKGTNGRYHLSKSVMVADFGATKNKKGGLFGERSVSYRNFAVNIPHADTTYKGLPVEINDEAETRTDQYWASGRGTDTLTLAESKVYSNVDSLKKMPSFRRTMDVVTLLVAGYKSFGPFEIGPANAFYSYNPVEGLRLRFGGRTTPELSRRYYFETYAAYGLKDERWKYFLSTTYSINNRSIYKFPQNYIRASFQRDTKIPGAELEFVTEDNFLLSFKRGINDKYLYNDYCRLDYVQEYENHLSYTLGFKKWAQSPGGALYFTSIENGLIHQVNDISTTELSASVRYAPHEQFFQGKIYRTTIPSKYPIITFNYAAGLKGLFNGQYNYQRAFAAVDKRFYLSQLGYTDVRVEGSYTFGRVPYLLLSIHKANQTYSYQPDSYNLMNFLEFVSDHYASINIDHCFNGFIFNKVPLLKKLKWREYITFKALYGGVRDENNPAMDQSLLQFQKDGAGVAQTYILGRTPYTEGSVGIGNILKFVRVDLVERFNYLDHPNATQFGIRTRVLFDF